MKVVACQQTFYKITDDGMEYRLEDAIGKPTGEDNGEVNGGVEKVPYLTC